MFLSITSRVGFILSLPLWWDGDVEEHYLFVGPLFDSWIMTWVSPTCYSRSLISSPSSIEDYLQDSSNPTTTAWTTFQNYSKYLYYPLCTQHLLWGPHTPKCTISKGLVSCFHPLLENNVCFTNQLRCGTNNFAIIHATYYVVQNEHNLHLNTLANDAEI